MHALYIANVIKPKKASLIYIHKIHPFVLLFVLYIYLLLPVRHWKAYTEGA